MKKLLIVLMVLATMSCRVFKDNTKEPGQDKRAKNFENIAKKLKSAHRK